MMNEYTYNVGLHDTGIKVSVLADCEEDAYYLACLEMDKRYEDKGIEPPVSWTLLLMDD